MDTDYHHPEFMRSIAEHAPHWVHTLAEYAEQTPDGILGNAETVGVGWVWDEYQNYFYRWAQDRKISCDQMFYDPNGSGLGRADINCVSLLMSPVYKHLFIEAINDNRSALKKYFSEVSISRGDKTVRLGLKREVRHHRTDQEILHRLDMIVDMIPQLSRYLTRKICVYCDTELVQNTESYRSKKTHFIICLNCIMQISTTIKGR